jgi:hypothetical protein
LRDLLPAKSRRTAEGTPPILLEANLSKLTQICLTKSTPCSPEGPNYGQVFFKQLNT